MADEEVHSPRITGTGGGAAAETAGEPVVVCEGISKHFGGITALDGIDLTLRTGEITALVGDNGAGKSTLTKVLAGIYSPDRGSIRILGVEQRFHGPKDAAAAPAAPTTARMLLTSTPPTPVSGRATTSASTTGSS